MDINVNELKLAVKKSNSISGVCRELSLSNNGYWFSKIKKLINKYNISISHFTYSGTQNYNVDLLKKLVKESTTYSEVCRGFNIKESGGNIRTIKRKIKKYNIDSSHFKGKGWNTGKRYINNGRKLPLKKILIKNSTYTNTNSLKKRLFKEGLKENKCEICNISEWLGKEISLQLDHINGIRNDNRIENLRILCPNCHSQTSTYAGKNLNKNRKTILK